MEEVDLRQDTIYLDDNSRAISESRLTGWQSEIGENKLAQSDFSHYVILPK